MEALQLRSPTPLRFESRLAHLTKQQLFNLAVEQAGATQEGLQIADAHLSEHVPLPEWAVTEVLLSNDLLPHVMRTLGAENLAAMRVCKGWRACWLASIVALHVAAMWACCAIWVTAAHASLGEAGGAPWLGNGSLLALCAGVLLPLSIAGGTEAVQPPLAAATLGEDVSPRSRFTSATKTQPACTLSASTHTLRVGAQTHAERGLQNRSPGPPYPSDERTQGSILGAPPRTGSWTSESGFAFLTASLASRRQLRERK